jgi:hypothetical protein
MMTHPSGSMRIIYLDERITDACLPHICAHMCARVLARVRVCFLGAHASAPKRAIIFFGGDCVWLGSQAFYKALQFNADIGAWNTACVTSLAGVCLRPAARPSVLGRSSMMSGTVLCGAAPPMRAGVFACALGIGTRLRRCQLVFVQLRVGKMEYTYPNT